MKALVKTLVFVALFFSISIPLIGFLQGQPLRQMFLTGLALAFATIPEELPIIITMNLGLGAYMLSKQNFLVKKLKAAETLGNATVIVTDKTGTLTESSMRVGMIFPEGDSSRVLRSARSAMTDLSDSITDRAIITAADNQHISADSGRIIREHSFETGKKTRAVIRDQNGILVLSVIGAPEEVLAGVSGDTSQAMAALARETARGQRVIAVAHRAVTPAERDNPFPAPERDLILDGLIAIEDPPVPVSGKR